MVRPGQRDYKKHLRAVPRELFAVERPHLKPLPAWIPEVYGLHQRLVDIEGYVALHTNRYSVPWTGSAAAWRCAKPRTRSRSNWMPADWSRTAVLPRPTYQRVTLAEHRPPRGKGRQRPDPHPEETGHRDRRARDWPAMSRS